MELLYPQAAQEETATSHGPTLEPLAHLVQMKPRREVLAQQYTGHPRDLCDLASGVRVGPRSGLDGG